MCPYDTGGRYLYLRDNSSGDYWSPTWQPTRHDLQEYTCRHGIGYTSITSRCHDITANVRYFVPLGETLEIWQATLSNHRSQAVDLSLFSCVEFCLWDAWDDSTNFQRNFNTGEVEVEAQTIYHKTEYRERRNHFAYFACSAEIDGFETQRENFLGAYHGWENPAAVVNGLALEFDRSRMGTNWLSPCQAYIATWRAAPNHICFGLSREPEQTRNSIPRTARF